MQKTRADRGDLYTLTAATFTVLTGFTRAGPAGPGIVKLWPIDRPVKRLSPGTRGITNPRS